MNRPLGAHHELSLQCPHHVRARRACIHRRCLAGDAKTGEIKWDCDCRPSDGCYLHLKVSVVRGLAGCAPVAP